jgi:hypothetical protein
LADVPVSLELFQVWYMTTVIAKQRSRYVVGEFLKDIIEKLILPAFGETCFMGAFKQLPIVSINMFSVPGFGSGNKSHPFINALEGYRYSTTAIKLIPGAELFNNTATHKPSTELFNFIYIYVSSIPTTQLKGIYREDVERGIYHIVPGLDRGIIKGITFSKNNVPYLTESKMFPDPSSGKKSDNVLATGIYNAKIKAIGTNLFRQGQLLYIDTSRFGMGVADAQKMLSSDLLIGGYYLVTKVGHNWDEYNYDTEIDAYFQSSASKEAGAKPKVLMKEDEQIKRVQAMSKRAVQAAEKINAETLRKVAGK